MMIESLQNSIYSREWIEEDRFLIYRFYDLPFSGVNTWYEDVVKIWKILPMDRPTHLMLDVSSQKGIISAHALLKARQASRARPGIHGRSAVLVSNSIAHQLISQMVRNGLMEPGRERQIFTLESEARKWVLAYKPTSEIENIPLSVGKPHS